MWRWGTPLWFLCEPCGSCVVLWDSVDPVSAPGSHVTLGDPVDLT